MRIRARIASTQAISTSLSDINRIRLSSPAIDIKPDLSLNDFTDVTTAGAKDDDILVFIGSTKQFTPTESTELFSIGTVSGGAF
jgi:hypothetical protein